MQNHLDAAPGNSVAMGTFTVAHNRTQPLDAVWDIVTFCWQAMTDTTQWRGGATVQGDKARYSIRHWVKFVEVTVGNRGWHVHLHAVLFLERTLSQDELETLQNRMYDRWAQRAVKLGFKRPSRERAVLLEQASTQDDVQAVANYVAKGHLKLESLHHEITGGAQKRARGDNLSPFELLEVIGHAQANGDNCARELKLWWEWEKASKGRRQCSWSRGAKDALGVFEVADSDVETDDLLDEQDELEQDSDQDEQDEQDELESVDPHVVALVDKEQWKEIADNTALRLEVVRYVQGARDLQHAVKRAHRILDVYGIRHRSVCIEQSSNTLDAVAPPLIPEQLPTFRSTLV